MEVSVVIPTFNRETTVVSSVESCLRQTLAPVEILVVDDGSSDGTVAVLRARFSAEARVRVIATGRNAGACAARNVGIAEAVAPWIAFLDSDDSWEPTKLERQAIAIEALEGAVAGVCGIRFMGPEGIVYDIMPPAEIRREDLFRGNALGSTSALIASREALRRAGGFDVDLPSCQDWDIYLRLRELGPIAAIREPLVIYDDGDHERISRTASKVLAGHRVVFERIYALDPDREAHWRVEHALLISEIAVYRRGRYLSGTLGTLALVLRHPSRKRFKRLSEVGKFLVWRSGRAIKRRIKRAGAA